MTLTPPDMMCFALYSAAHAMQQAYKPLLDQLDLTYPQFLVLTVLWGEDGQTVGAIGRALHLESNTLTPLLKRMEAQGLITRRRDAGDERQVLVKLSPYGSLLREQGTEVQACIFQKTGMSAETLGALRDQVLVLRDTVKR